jgi:hypothetical protein
VLEQYLLAIEKRLILHLNEISFLSKITKSKNAVISGTQNLINLGLIEQHEKGLMLTQAGLFRHLENY